VWISRLTGVADEMGAVLRRAAYSPNIKERADCSCALFTADGTLLCRPSTFRAPGSMPAAVRAAIDACGDAIAADEQIIVKTRSRAARTSTTSRSSRPSSPTGGLHRMGCQSRHHADVGGMAARLACRPTRPRFIQEGLRIPAGALTHEVEALFLAASRTPDERRGDLDAQRGRTGWARCGCVALRRQPRSTTRSLTYGERRMRAALRSLPDGTYEFEDVLDSTGAAASSPAARRGASDRSSTTR
jgi:N-methylhydantoinase B/oxoprolinase/acetone carboxylase alpha subunit